MEYKNEELGVSFTLPETVTVRQQLAYFSQAALGAGNMLFERWWMAATTLIEDWKCETIPSLRDLDLDSITDMKATQIIMWASNQVKQHVDKLESVPKN